MLFSAMENARGPTDSTSILFSTNQTAPQVRQLLASSIVNANARDKFNSSPLHWASIRGRADIVAVLLEPQFGADVNAQNEQGVSPLSAAVKAGHTSVVQMLLGHDKCDVNASSPRTAFSALHEACARVSENGKIDIVQLLLLRGANFEACDARGRLPIDLVPRTSPQRVKVKQAIEEEIVRRGQPEQKTLLESVATGTKQFIADCCTIHVELLDPLKLNRDLWSGVWSLVVPNDHDREPGLEDINSPGRPRF